MWLPLFSLEVTRDNDKKKVSFYIITSENAEVSMEYIHNLKTISFCFQDCSRGVVVGRIHTLLSPVGAPGLGCSCLLH